jgi:hypothetical protein
LSKIINVFLLIDSYTVKLNSTIRGIQVGINEQSVRKKQP